MESNDRGMALIVEDDWLCAQGLKTILQELGFESIHCAHNISGGALFLSTATPRLAVLDVNLGDDLVFPLAQSLRERGVPIIFASGLSRADFPPEWACYPLATKPVSKAALAKAFGELANM